MNIHEAIDHLMEKEGNAAAVFFGEDDAGMQVFSGSLPASNSVMLWVKHDDMQHPVPFSINSDLMSATFFLVSQRRNIKKGDFVRMVHSRFHDLTNGRLYEVKAAEGDVDTVCGGLVNEGCFISTADSGIDFYSSMNGLFGRWELQ